MSKPYDAIMEEAADAIENLMRLNEVLRIGIKHIQSMCGNPDTAESRRLIIKKCEELLNES